MDYDDRNKLIFRSVVADGKTLKVVGEEWGIGLERVRQIVDREAWRLGMVPWRVKRCDIRKLREAWKLAN